MKIQPTNFNNTSNTSASRDKVAFKHKSAYSYLKNVPGNRCACCGRDMILSKEIADVWGKITRPLTVLMQEGRFNFAETVFPSLYKVLASFAQKYPEDSLDSIVSNSNNHFQFMASIADSFKGDSEYKKLSGQQQQKAIKNRTMEIFRISSSYLRNAIEVIQNLKPLEHYLYGYRKDIFQELEKLAQKYPDKKIHELVRIPEVASKYVENTYYEAIDFARTRDEHWNKANKIILDRAPVLEADLDKLHTKICLIYRGIIDPARVSYEIREEYKTFLDKHNLNDIKEPVLEEIAQMPNSLFSKNSFLSFARRYYNDGEIINYVIKPFMESVEHVVAVSDGGTNDSANIIMMCRKCNNDRGSYPYTEHLAIHPEMVENSERQIRFYADKLLAGELPETLEKYPIEIAKTLRKCSSGRINYDTTDYSRALAEKQKTNS